MAAECPDQRVPIPFLLDGLRIEACPGETILEAAHRQGVEIPHLCYQEGQRAEGSCRACVVEVEGERTLTPACCRHPTPGMAVRSASGRARRSQRLVLELLCADTAGDAAGLGELDRWRERLGVPEPRFPRHPAPMADGSHPAIAVHLAACIQCTRCVRACREVQVNDVIGYARRGAASRIVFDLNDPLGASSCVACGECVQSCPTGALRSAAETRTRSGVREIDSLCPYCGVGCQLTYRVAGNRILEVRGRNGPANQGRLCVKGRYGLDYAQHPDRLRVPLIRRDGSPKTAELILDPLRARSAFREASWKEAMERTAAGFLRILREHGPAAIAGFGSAKGSNEEAYLFQKLVRAGFGTNNVDHCTRLCHASSVAALLQIIGSGAVSNPVADVGEAEVVVVIGSDTAANHPVAATFIKNAARNGKTLIVIDPRETPLARHADHFLRLNPGTDVALLNALMQSIVEEDLVDRELIERRTRDFEVLKAHLAAFSPERVAPLCGIDAATLRTVARIYARSRGSMIFWGMGVTQHVHGTDNARCLISLALMTGQIGRPGTGLHPLRGQNNVQGASDAGLIPMMLPDYRPVDDPAAREYFETLWGRPLDSRPGLTMVEIIHAASAGEIRGMYILGENPAMSDPNLAPTPGRTRNCLKVRSSCRSAIGRPQPTC